MIHNPQDIGAAMGTLGYQEEAQPPYFQPQKTHPSVSGLEYSLLRKLATKYNLHLF